MKPLSVAYGVGVDSTAMLVGYWQRGIRPDLIIFSDVGAEREATYAYLPVINAWLRSVRFPGVTVVKYQPKKFKHWPPYKTIEENVLTNTSLPAISYGGHSCSAKWKISPQDEFMATWQPALDAWANGMPVRRAVGFEDSPHEHNRAKRCATFAVQDLDTSKYEVVFPLQEWGWDRDRCVKEIQSAGLPVPSKSSCFMCCAMKPWEVDELTQDKHMRIVIMEARALQRNIDYTEARRKALTSAVNGTFIPPKGPPREATSEEVAAAARALRKMPPEGTPMTAGLWRQAVKGMRGATAKPGSMTEYIRQKGLLPGPLIDALIRLTPRHPLSKEDFDAQGLSNWQEWITKITEQAKTESGTTPLPT